MEIVRLTKAVDDTWQTLFPVNPHGNVKEEETLWPRCNNVLPYRPWFGLLIKMEKNLQADYDEFIDLLREA